MKASDIPDSLILNYLATQQGKWTGLYGVEFWTCGDDLAKKIVVVPNVREKVLLAKMRSLYKRGLVGGCDCGCRGDFEITDKGLALIGKPRTEEYTGY